VGPAVVRNRLKRRVREIFRRWSGRRTLPGLDLVVHLQPAAAATPAAKLREELERLLAAATPRPRSAS
jgi:ribonuclease P protein component